MSNKTYVRLKKVNKPKGYVCRRYMFRGVLFKSGEWRRVSTVVASELAELIQPNSADSPKPLFDIAVDREAAEAMDRIETPATKVAGAHDVEASAFRGLEDAPKDPIVAGSDLREPEEVSDDEETPGTIEVDDTDFEEEVEDELEKKAPPKRPRKTRSRK